MPDLRYLLIVGNGTSDISALSACTHLTYFVSDNNSIVDITALGGLLELTTLSLKSNLIEDISPLVGNAGLSSGDQVALEGNPLSAESINTHIPALQARGVTVTF
jgi:Leucine-rich repeat (LRR) protein